jgi:hypothetical protein
MGCTAPKRLRAVVLNSKGHTSGELAKILKRVRLDLLAQSQCLPDRVAAAVYGPGAPSPWISKCVIWNEAFVLTIRKRVP